MATSPSDLRHACGELARWLAERYAGLSHTLALDAAVQSRLALQAFGLDSDDDADRLWRLTAEREVRLRLGLDHEEARLDPQPHPARRQPKPRAYGASGGSAPTPGLAAKPCDAASA